MPERGRNLTVPRKLCYDQRNRPVGAAGRISVSVRIIFRADPCLQKNAVPEETMISYLKGIFVGQNADGILVEVNGIGYSVSWPSADPLPSAGEPIKVYTFLYLKEDVLALYGFSSEEELSLFRMMLKVSGIGPKGAMAVLSGMTPAQLRTAILSQDAKTIAGKSSGIGIKTAQKMILELRDKVSAFGSEEGTPLPDSKTDVSEDEAVLALMSLGYAQSAAVRAVGSIPDREKMTTEEVLKAALRSGKLF